jgi:hypothetical protein
MGDMQKSTQAMKLQAAENDLKELMADVARAMEKAQEAVARIASNALGRWNPQLRCARTHKARVIVIASCLLWRSWPELLGLHVGR